MLARSLRTCLAALSMAIALAIDFAGLDPVRSARRARPFGSLRPGRAHVLVKGGAIRVGISVHKRTRGRPTPHA